MWRNNSHEPLANIPTRGAPDWQREAMPYSFPAHDGWADFCGEIVWVAEGHGFRCNHPKYHAGAHRAKIVQENRAHRAHRRPQFIFWTTTDMVEQYDEDGRLTNTLPDDY